MCVCVSKLPGWTHFYVPVPGLTDASEEDARRDILGISQDARILVLQPHLHNYPRRRLFSPSFFPPSSLTSHEINYGHATTVESAGGAAVGAEINLAPREENLFFFFTVFTRTEREKGSYEEPQQRRHFFTGQFAGEKWLML